jgi:glycosyltransferase involved in cell wall biosynthesis
MNRIAVLIPCFNEEITVADVVKSFKKVLPQAIVYVYDNCSEDNTADIARDAGAVVIESRNRGKGNVVREMFANIDADTYIIVDGDSTYTAEDAPKMVQLLQSNQLDMVIASRQEDSETAYPNGHKFGNYIFNLILKIFFKSSFSDIFSGYRAFSRRFVKTFPVMTNGFDIEVELSIHALSLSIPCAEIASKYRERPKNSHSKLHTFRDGFKVLFSIVKLLKEVRPLFFFGVISLMMAALSVALAYPLIMTFLDTGLVPRFPTAILSTGLMMISFLSLACGLILDSVSQARMEIKKLHYLKM